MQDEKISDGATLWARQTIESDIFFYKPDKWFKIWFYIVNKVNYKDAKLFDRGSNLITYADISYKTKATKNQIDMFIRWAKKSEMLTTKKTTRGMVVTILNYERYQSLENYKNEMVTEKETKRERNGNDTINKKERMEVTHIDNTSVLSIVEIYHKILPNLQQVRISPKTGKIESEIFLTNIKARILKYPEFKNLQEWENLFIDIRENRSFLQGENHRGWKASLSWMVKKTNFEKILDGDYIDRQNSTGSQKTDQNIKTVKRWLERRNASRGGHND